jgi:hypothetical protein
MISSAGHQQKSPSLLLFVCAFIFVYSPSASAQFKAWIMSKLPDTLEGLGVDSKGNIYASLFHTGEVVMLKQDGSYDHIAWVPSKEESGNGDLSGLDLDRQDNLYVAYKAHSKYDPGDLRSPFHPSCRDVTVTRSGVYKIDAKTHNVTALATRPGGWPFCFPDNVVVDSRGNVYMTDLTYSAIWKISPDGKKVDLWSAHPLLNPSSRPYSGYFAGVNDLALASRCCLLDTRSSTTSKRRTLSPWLMVMIRQCPTSQSGRGIDDGVELDAKGNIFVSEILQNDIWVVSPTVPSGFRSPIR